MRQRLSLFQQALQPCTRDQDSATYANARDLAAAYGIVDESTTEAQAFSRLVDCHHEAVTVFGVFPRICALAHFKPTVYRDNQRLSNEATIDNECPL